MQMIEAIIRSQKLDAVKAALAEIGVRGATAIDCKGFGNQLGHVERYRGAQMGVAFVPKIMLRVCVKDVDVDSTVDAIMLHARSGEVGDGKIFVYPVEKVYRIRTKEEDDAAI